MRTCSVCSNPQVDRVNALLKGGTSIRKVSQVTGLTRSTLARHVGHMEPGDRRFGVIQGGERNEGGPDGTADPLAEAFKLAAKARTARERLRALEQVRAATRLKLRGAGDPDREGLDLLGRNLQEAEAAYRDAPDFETQARALSGWREAIAQRLDAVPADAFEVRLNVMTAGKPVPLPPTLSEPRPMKFSAEQYWKGVPSRFRDPERYVVERTIHLALPGCEKPSDVVKVYDAKGTLVWAE